MTCIQFSFCTAISMVVLVCSSKLNADEIQVQFSGAVTDSGGVPGWYVGETFTGEFSYSTTDPFDVSVDGQSTYSLTSPEDSESVSVGSFNLLLQPLTGLHAFVSPGTSSYFLTQDFAAPGTPYMSLAFYGGSGFLSSQALPDPLNTAAITAGNIAFGFSENNVAYGVQGNITQVSTTPEPRSVVWVLGMLALVALAFRRSFKAFQS